MTSGHILNLFTEKNSFDNSSAKKKNIYHMKTFKEFKGITIKWQAYGPSKFHTEY